ncbi:MAG: alanine dehydrogenase [Deltaproteobacteria bacterium]|nr:alanine dehydrogenase [Deltaproteobacteria bacterium]
MTKIGIPKETKQAERRVALLPEACHTLIKAGHSVFLETKAGLEAGFDDTSYESLGVRILPDAKSLYGTAELIVKVKEPQPEELLFLRKDHLLFCFLHLAAFPLLTEGLKSIGLTAVGYETVEIDGQTPLLAPMSAVAGRLSVQLGAWFLHAPQGGRGVLLGGFDQTDCGRVMILGAGVAGSQAAILALGMGAETFVFDVQEKPLAELAKKAPGVKTLMSTPENINLHLPDTDLLIGAVYLRGKAAPKIISRSQIGLMAKGTVVIDVAIDQGGCVETSKPCTYQEPVYEVMGVLHSAITNLPAAVPHTASIALSRAILPYLMKLADGNLDGPLLKGINIKDHELKIEF